MLRVKFKKLGFFKGIAALAAGVLLLSAVPMTQAHAAGALTVQDEQAAEKLAAQLVQLVTGMPTTSSQADYTSVIVGASAGTACPIAKVALGIVAGTNGIPNAAANAARAVAANCSGAAVSAVTTPPPAGPDFSPGGGGSNYH